MHKDTDQNLITPEFIDLLRTEGTKIWAICLNINSDNTYKQAIASILDPNFKNTSYKFEHLVLRDIVKIYNTFSLHYNATSRIPQKIKFALIYLYEKLQGKDLAKSFDIQKLTKLPLSNQFDKNIALIQETSFFQPIESLKSEYLSTLILKKNNSSAYESVASFLNRTALIMAQSDGTIAKKEEETLKEISKKVSNPKISIKNSKYNDVPEDDTLEKVLEELNELIGLEEIKKNVNDLINFLKVQKLREEKGLKTNQNSLHFVFMGPPGTGKTTVARMLGRIFKHLGYLKRGHLVETDRSGLIAGYVGQTAIKTDEIITAATDGVLFVDEAYALSGGGLNDFGKEAIEIILKRMEDLRNNLVVVVAGYPDEMEIFIESNPGLQSRFNRYLNFNHYEPNSLLKIFELIATKSDFKLTEDAKDKLLEIIERVYEKRHKGFGNARTMRNLFEKIIERQANRIVTLDTITEELLITITEEDIPEILKTVKEISVFEED
ncbi:AAA family ATPase [Cellulophaga baltica]|uniref:AAA family ATPase n=1 Tax=Cellulophaga TaxID=104264 RepID=UPI001C06D49E|nr:MULTISPECIES: AAA family ATPase [Cellulophaga]MBU2997614.1 AAA family ATPase [Cellulophaga baltica]MDO6769009.1 AAA family ATPase [Cellulophaga sp. 1_MG-2023]